MTNEHLHNVTLWQINHTNAAQSEEKVREESFLGHWNEQGVFYINRVAAVSCSGNEMYTYEIEQR